MNELDTLYSRFLMLGFIALRQAVSARDYEWAEAEIELLHNVPSLLGESNVARHRYFWFTEREHYIQWVTATGRDELKSRLRTYYEPLWQEMEPILLEFLSAAALARKT
ncbi:MAG: hypothetical protein WD063_12370 [Pirellulales bacterium]